MRHDAAGGSPALQPGQWVWHPEHAEWGPGQVQSAVRERITINFEHAGKVLVNGNLVALSLSEPAR